MNDLRLVLVCGLPGAGKTTRARAIVRSRRALYLNADDWVLGLRKSLVDYEFRVVLQDCLLGHAREVLRCGLSVVLEFGSWSRAERENIRQAAVQAHATTELHFLDAPLAELVQRVRARGGPDAEVLASTVLLQHSARFERPSEEEIALFDHYFGPDDPWPPSALRAAQ